jgi:uncharacterized protein YkwD
LKLTVFTKSRQLEATVRAFVSREYKGMRAALAAALAAALVVLALTLPGRASATSRLTRVGGLRVNVITLINHTRASHGLRRLHVRRRLSWAAGAHTRAMARHGYFAHGWYTGAGFGTWMRWYYPGPGFRSWSAGENLFWRTRSPSARTIVRAWMNSPAHRANLLGHWRHIGLSVIRVRHAPGLFRWFSSVTIVTADFGRRRRHS